MHLTIAAVTAPLASMVVGLRFGLGWVVNPNGPLVEARLTILPGLVAGFRAWRDDDGPALPPSGPDPVDVAEPWRVKPGTPMVAGPDPLREGLATLTEANDPDVAALARAVRVKARVALATAARFPADREHGQTEAPTADADPATRP